MPVNSIVGSESVGAGCMESRMNVLGNVTSLFAMSLYLIFSWMVPQPRDVAVVLVDGQAHELAVESFELCIRLAKVMDPVVYTGVKSTGRLNRMTHLPLKSPGDVTGPWIVSAWNAGALSPIGGIVVCCCPASPIKGR